MTDQHFWTDVVKRVAEHKWTMGSAMQTFMQLQHIDERKLAEILRCKQSDLLRLALCRRPSGHGPTFQKQAEALADEFRLDSRSLIELIRLTESIDAFRLHGQDSDAFLRAARDRPLSDDDA